ncbi:methenyltetrahydrofolate synthase domain-containing protein-like [Lucilia sericata]|uniref:methenyltetrahydrofolate synthase domain-containing protein-like n=1 Tax=Lucilia sericata TaxID=13632 RepID=UPI0018A82090|nr:methenyltetrahydrofolate synthase domain-containing protein-like [Lucilia sericata]XP_037821572.1 methenyltetrahydrofolate synthase domain-containing protein-like [Lucilia sericata]
METENSNQTPAAATEEAAATKNGGNATQEVSSTTQAVEPTKRSLRVQTWKKLQENKFGVPFNAIFNRIPGFVDNDKAAALLAETEEFKNAKEIKILIDRALYAAKLQTLLAGKNLYLPGTSDSKALYLKVDVPADATEEQKTEILNVRNVEKHRTEISLENKVELDMVIIGSVVVSRDGYRIGRGNGFNDLDIGLLKEVGSITDKTVIATMVHDAQVVDNLPINLFQKYDSPVDMIITPTEVIRVAKRLPRPAGIFWELLSERRLKIIPVLQVLKETQEKAGKVIVLKEEDTDVEQHQRRNNRRRFMPRRRFGGNRRFQRRAVSQNNADQQQDGENNGQQQKRQTHRRRFVNRRRRPTKSEGDQSGVESKSQDRKSVGEGGNRRPKLRKNRPMRDFSVKLSNISRDVRIKDLKSELRNRQCNPMAITWKGQYGRCYLHFGNRNGQPSTEDDMNKVLQALNDLSLTITPSDNKNNKTAATNGEDGGAAGDAAGGEQKQDEQKTEGATKPPKVVNLKVELIKYSDKANNNAAAAAGAGGAVNGGGDPATGGEASSARIESVDTTTV